MTTNMLPTIFVAASLVQFITLSCAFKEEPNNAPEFRSFTNAPTAATQSNTVMEMERELVRLRTQLSDATRNVNTLQNELNGEIALRQTREQQLTDRLSQIENNQGTQAPCSAQLVAFTADVSQKITNLQDGQAVVFDSIVTNVANSYNSSSGKFRAPVRGLYYFTVTIMSSPGETVTTQFFINGLKEAVNFAAADHLGGSGSNAILIDIHPGDLVWIALFQAFPGNIEPIKSSFSGHLIQST